MGRFSLWKTLLALLLCACISSCGKMQSVVDASPRPRPWAADWLPPSTLQFYEHEIRAGPDTNAVLSASPSGNANAREFGAIMVDDHVLREGIENTSKVLGSAKGIVTIEKDSSIFVTLTFFLNTSSYAGSISIQGVQDSFTVFGLPSSFTSEEFAVTGGTGDFRFARGYVESATVFAGVSSSVFKNTLYLKYY